MAKSSDIIKIGFDYRASLEQFVKETNGVFDGISEKAGKQRISIQLDAKNDKVIEKIKELQKLKLDSFTFEFGESGLAEQLKTFDQLEKKITEIINLSKGINKIGSGNGIGNSIVDEKSLNSIIDLFGKMENHLGEIKRVFTDVGDGGEFSPLLSTIDKINASIKELSTSVKGIGLNMNIDVGSDAEMEAKVQSKISNALQAYQRLFDHIKMTGVGGSMINTSFFEFDINQYDTMMAKLQAYRKFIENMRNEAKAQFNGKDILYSKTDKSYWSSASAAMGQITKAFNEMNASADTSPLENLFGGKTDLTEVVSQLNLIVDKLGEISTTASEFKNVFANGFNVSTSVEEIEKLTDRVKELEDELSKVKVSSISPVETNISSPIKDTFQGDKIEQATTSAKELDKTLEQAVDVSTDDFDEILSKLDLTKSKLGEIVKITKQGHAGEDGKFIESFVLKDKNGSSETYGTSSNTEKGQLLRYNYIEKNTEAINKQKNAEKEHQAQKDAFHKKNLNAIDMEIKKREEESSAYAKTLKSQMEERYSAISSMEKSLDNYNSKLEKFSVKPADGHRYPVYQQQIDNLTKKIGELDTLKNNLSKKDIIDESDMKSVNALQQEIDELILKMNNMSAGERGFDPLGADKTLEKINSELKKNSAMSKEAKRQIQGFYDEIRSGNPSKPIKDLLDDMYKLIQAERLAGREGKSFMDIFKEKVVYGAAANMAGMIGIYDIINVGRQATDIVIDLNTQITELAKVSEDSMSQIYDDFNSYAEIAKDIGGTISDTISATSDWSRNGYSIPDSKELAKVALLYKNVGDGIDIDTANESLISTLRGFEMEAKDALDIINIFNEVSNNEAISSAGIGEALQRSAASFNAANTSLQESVALISATNSVVQNPERVGNMWKVVSMRIRSASSELEQAGEDTDGLVETTADLQKMIKAMTGYDILEADGETFKSIYDIVLNISKVWHELSDLEQSSLLQALAGKQQSNALAAALSNTDILEKSYKEAMNAEGSAMEEQRKYQESVQYSIDRTKASLEELANDFLSSDFLKGLIDSGDKLINILDWIIDKFGVLGTLAGGAGIFAGIKNVGEGKMYPFIVLNSQQQYVFFRIRKFSYCQ